jgi:hypothetical protein
VREEDWRRLKVGLVKIGAAMGWVLIGACSATARGDGGTIRVSQCEGAYRITVFTAPTPFRAGAVDISVLVQDAATGELVPEARVTLQLTPQDRPGQPMHQTALSKAATNKLLKAAIFELPEPGRWKVEVTIDGAPGIARVVFELMAAGRVPQWPALWPWIGWPALVILLFSIHQLLVWRKIQRPA